MGTKLHSILNRRQVDSQNRFPAPIGTSPMQELAPCTIQDPTPREGTGPQASRFFATPEGVLLGGGFWGFWPTSVQDDLLLWVKNRP